MADRPARRGYDPAAEDAGWGSPMPAEYGSLTAFLPPLDESPAPDSRGQERTPAARPAQRRWRVRKAARAGDARPSPNGSAPGPAADGTVPDGTVPAWTSASVAPPRPDAVSRTRAGRPGGATPVTRDPRGIPPPATVPVPVVPVGPPPVRSRVGPSPAGDQQSRDTFGSRRRRRKANRPQWAQSRRTVRHLNVWTVAKVSLAFYIMVLIAVVVASVMLWYVADAFGSIQSIEKSVRTLFDLSEFTIHPRSVAIYTSIGGGVLAVCGTFANILAALMYNLISDLIGGIRFDVVDEGR